MLVYESKTLYVYLCVSFVKISFISIVFGCVWANKQISLHTPNLKSGYLHLIFIAQ